MEGGVGMRSQAGRVLMVLSVIVLILSIIGSVSFGWLFPVVEEKGYRTVTHYNWRVVVTSCLLCLLSTMALYALGAAVNLLSALSEQLTELRKELKMERGEHADAWQPSAGRSATDLMTNGRGRSRGSAEVGCPPVEDHSAGVHSPAGQAPSEGASPAVPLLWSRWAMWICRQCKTVNDSQDTHCKACGAARDERK